MGQITIEDAQLTARQVVMQQIGGELVELRGEVEYWKIKAKEYHDAKIALRQKLEAAGIEADDVVSVVPEGIPPEVAAKIAELQAQESAQDAPDEEQPAIVVSAALEEEDSATATP